MVGGIGGRFGRRLAPAPALAAVGGAVAGLFLGRLLAEDALAPWFWQPLPVAALAALSALTAAVLALAAGRRVPASRLVAPTLALFLPAVYLVQHGADSLQARVLLAGMAATAAFLAAADPRAGSRRLARVVTVALLALPFLVYLRTLSPTVGEADSFEFQVTASRLGVAHPTGYPLYILLGRLFILLPLGDVAYRVNLTSPVFASLAVVFLYLTVARLMRRRDAALIAALTFALSRTFWSQAVIAEVYALHAFLVAVLLYLALATAPASPARRWLPLVAGLSLTNHLTAVLMAPALAACLLWDHSPRRLCRAPADPIAPATPPRRTPRWRQALQAGGLFLLGLSVYLYIPLRWPALNEGRPMGLRQFVAWVTGYRFRDALQLGAWLRDPVRYRILGRLVLEQYGAVGVALTVAGVVWLLWKERRAGVCLLLVWAAYAFYALNYVVSDVSVFLIPAHLAMAVAAGAALAAAARWLEAKHELLPALLTVVAALLPLSLAWGNWPRVDRSQAGRTMLSWGRRVLRLGIAPGASILADSEKIAPLYYLQTAEGVRPDLDIAVMGDEVGYRQALEARLAAGRPVYLARFLPGLEGRFHLRSLGPLVEVGTAPLTAMSPAEHPLTATFGSAITLLGYDAGRLEVARGSAVQLTLYWRAQAAVDGSYQVRLRLLGAGGRVAWEQNAHPVHGLYPTAAWKPGEIIPDSYEVPIDRAMPPGRYGLAVGLFLPFSDQGLTAGGSGEGLLPLAELQVVEAQGSAGTRPGFATPLRARVGELLLVGSDYPQAGRPGGRLHITLFWRRLAPCADYEVVVELLDEGGRVLGHVGEPPFYGEWPASRWPRGQTVATTHVLKAPASDGRMRLQVGLRDPSSGRFVAVYPGWLSPPGERYRLGTVRLEGTPLSAGAANLGDRIYLLSHELNRQTLRPGDAVDLAVTWQCARRMGEDYTVFVHLLDASDRVRGQVDVWPVQGTYPTSQWAEGEIIRDTYSVRLDRDASPGAYRLEIGWYLLATMERLPVLDDDMRPVENRVVIDGLQVEAPGQP